MHLLTEHTANIKRHLCQEQDLYPKALNAIRAQYLHLPTRYARCANGIMQRNKITSIALSITDHHRVGAGKGDQSEELVQ